MRCMYACTIVDCMALCTRTTELFLLRPVWGRTKINAHFWLVLSVNKMCATIILCSLLLVIYTDSMKEQYSGIFSRTACTWYFFQVLRAFNLPHQGHHVRCLQILALCKIGTKLERKNLWGRRENDKRCQPPHVALQLAEHTHDSCNRWLRLTQP